jgi:chromate reductase, NAD(P)H dehydrogenase (quinone)
MLRLLAISGSLRAQSLNTAALRACAALARAPTVVTLYDGLAALPAFNPDVEEGMCQEHPALTALCRAVDHADGFLFAVPEYAHGVPGALKNLLDWLVGHENFAGKPTALINVAPRAIHANASLREILSTMAAGIVAEACVTLPLAGRKWTNSEILADSLCRMRLEATLAAIEAAMRARR